MIRKPSKNPSAKKSPYQRASIGPRIKIAGSTFHPRASVARPRTAHMPSAASASALFAAAPVEAPPPAAASPATASSELDAHGDHDTPLSMAPLSTAPSVP